MDQIGLVTNVVAIAVSLMALSVSSWLAFRQTKYVRHANHQPIIMMMAEFRDPQFRADIDFIDNELGDRAKYDPSAGLTGLPEDARRATMNVLYYFQLVATLTVTDIVDEWLVTVLLGRRILRAWVAVQPFVEADRRTRRQGIQVFRVLEELAVRCAAMTLDRACRELRLRRFDLSMLPNGAEWLEPSPESANTAQRNQATAGG